MRSDIVSLHKIYKAVVDRRLHLTPFEEAFLQGIRAQVMGQSGEVSKKQRPIHGKIQAKILQW